MKAWRLLAALAFIVGGPGCALRAIEVRAVAADVPSPKLLEGTALLKRYDVPLVAAEACAAGGRLSAPSLGAELVDSERIATLVGYLASLAPTACGCLQDSPDTSAVVVTVRLPGGGGQGTAQAVPDGPAGRCLVDRLDMASLAAGVTPIAISYEYKLPRFDVAAGGVTPGRGRAEKPPAPSVEPPAAALKTASGLAYESLSAASPTATERDVVRLRYRGWDEKGNEVAGSQDETLAVSELLPGLAEGLRLVRPGEKARLYLPPSLAGAGKPAVTAAGPLVFEVELLKVLPPSVASAAATGPAVRAADRSEGSETPRAAGVALGADLGFSRITNGDGMNGFGFDAFAGYELDNGLVIEGQLGVHRFSTTVMQITATTTLVPIFGGVRYRFDLQQFKPFVGAHVGFGRTSASVGDVSASSTDFGLNLGGGGDFAVSDRVGLGGALWYTRIFGDPEDAELVQLGLDLRIKL